MSSNSPSGGMKEMVRSFSKRESRTHWWNFTSSSSTDLLLPPGLGGKGEGGTDPRPSGSLCQRHPIVWGLPLAEQSCLSHLWVMMAKGLGFPGNLPCPSFNPSEASSHPDTGHMLRAELGGLVQSESAAVRPRSSQGCHSGTFAERPVDQAANAHGRLRAPRVPWPHQHPLGSGFLSWLSTHPEELCRPGPARDRSRPDGPTPERPSVLLLWR